MNPSNLKHLLFRSGLAVAGLALTALLPPAARAQSALELQIEEGGQFRAVELATDEIEVARTGEQPAGRLSQTITGKVAGAAIVEDSSSRVLVKLPVPYNRNLATLRSERIDLAVPDAETSPVFYIKGAARDKWSRRLGSKSLLVYLNPGQTSEQAREAAGAASVRETGIEGVTVLKFATPFHALDATKRLDGRGVRHQPLLRQFMQKKAAPPKDQFFNEQWHLVNSGQRNGVPGIDIDVLPVWDFGLGNGVTISIVDDCLETTHPDLRSNCPPISTRFHHDFNDDDDDPKPINANGDFHGTSVGGLAGARQNNGSPDPTTGRLLGVSGVAPEARLLGLRLIAGPITDQDVADALTWGPSGQVVDVSNNSWGINDAIGLGGFDILGKAALRDAALKGRAGRGQVTVFSAGNGRGIPYFYNANYSSITNSRFVVAVAALSSTGVFSSYSTPGAPVLVTAPGGGLGFTGVEQRCITTDVTGVGGLNPAAGDLANTDYTRQMNGTSAAAPITSGVVSLMLQANPNLSWRDVKEILAGTARKVDETQSDWVVRPAATGDARSYNGGGFKFNHNYGAGLVDAFAAVVRAQTWPNLTTEVSQTLSIREPGTGTLIADDAVTKLRRTFDFSGANFPNRRLEQIEIEMLITHPHRSDLEIVVISPSGVRSVLAERRNRPILNTVDTDIDYRDIVVDFATGRLVNRSGGWVFTTTHHWGENSNGTWTVEIVDRTAGSQGRLVSTAIRLYGTAAGEQRVMFDKQLYSVNEPAGVPITGTYSQSANVITVTATDHALAVGGLVNLNFTSGTPDSAVSGLFPVVDSTPGVSFTVAAPDSVARDGNVVATPAITQPITLRRLGPTTGTFSVRYQTSVGTATAGQDYRPGADTVTFADGQTTADVQIPILADTDPEVNETVQVVLTNLVGAEVAYGGNTLTKISIVDDEVNLVKVTATDPEGAERGNNGVPDPAVFTLTRSKLTDQALNVFFNLGGSAQPGLGAGGDFNPLPNSAGVYIATIPAFEETVEVTILPREDGVSEGAENVVLSLLPSPGYKISTPEIAEVSIIDLDRPSVRMTLLDNLATETATAPPSNTARFSISRTFAAGNSLVVFLQYGGTQILGTNYLLTYPGPDGVTRTLADPLASTSVEIGPNQSSVEVTVVPLNDDIYQATKTADIGLLPKDDYAFNFNFITNVHLNIFEDDPFPDTKIPALAITTPRTNTRIDAPATIQFSGSATDNVSVVRALYRINGGAWRTLPITPGKTVTWDIPIDYVTLQGVVTLGNADITGLTDTSKLVVGMPASGAGIPANATIVSIGAGKVTLDKVATASSPTATVRFSFLALGPNSIEAEAIDDDGNVSRIASTLFNYVQLRTLTVNVNGPGDVTRGFRPTSQHEVGKTVLISAAATAGNVFNGWTGLVQKLGAEPVPQRTISFVMPNEDSTLTANFVQSPFLTQITGAYSGLVENDKSNPKAIPGEFAMETSGYLRANVTPTGAFSGVLVLGGVPYRLIGEFTGTGRYVGQLKRTNNFPLTIDLTIDVAAAGGQQIVGTISANTFASNVIAKRAAYGPGSPAPAALVGRYTLLMPPASPIADAQRDPRGNGTGILVITADGSVRWSGVLADGTAVSQTQPLARDNTWPLFLNLYRGRGVMLGNIVMDATQPGSDLSGKVDWLKPVISTSFYFPIGFRILDATFIGARYTPPAAGVRALTGFTNVADNARITLQEGSLLGDILRTGSFTETNTLTVTNPGTQKLNLRIDPLKGLFSGSFIHPVSSRATAIGGVLFQKQAIGAGRFLGSSVSGVNPQTGRVLIEAVKP